MRKPKSHEHTYFYEPWKGILSTVLRPKIIFAHRKINICLTVCICVCVRISRVTL